MSYKNHILTNDQLSMKLDKAVVQRRLDLMAAEGVVSFWTCSVC